MFAWLKDRIAYWKSQGKKVGLLGGDHSTPLPYHTYFNELGEEYGIIHVDVMNETEEQEKRAKEFKEKTELFIGGLDVDEMIAQLLITEGFRTIEEIAFVDIAELEEIEGFNPELAAELQKRAKDYLERIEKNYFEEGHKIGMSDDLLNFTFIKRPIIMQLGAAGIKSLTDLADLATDELVEILGEDTMSNRLAGRVIMKAREIAYDIKQDEE